jgi:hypothetical protein
MQHSAEDRLRQVFEQASGILTSKTESAQNAEWENLFASIAGHRDSTISVSGDLGETLIRLGISIEFRTLQKTIHKVCLYPTAPVHLLPCRVINSALLLPHEKGPVGDSDNDLTKQHHVSTSLALSFSTQKQTII